MKRLLLSFAVVAGLSTSAGAQQINNAGDPALAGATLVNFNSATMGLFSSMTFGGLTISGIGGQLMMTNQWNGSYGATGIHFQNYTGTGTTQTVRFSFTGGTSAFGFSLGAADTRPSLLTAYDVNNNVRLYAGYDFLYWSSVVRPGDQIDLTLDANRIPNAGGPFPAVNQVRPRVPFTTTSYFAHGVSGGVELRY